MPSNSWLSRYVLLENFNANIISRRDDILSQSDDLISRSDEKITRRDDIISRRDEILSRSDDLISRSDDIITRSDDLISRSDYIITRSDDFISRSDDIISRRNELLNKISMSLPGSVFKGKETFIRKNMHQNVQPRIIKITQPIPSRKLSLYEMAACKIGFYFPVLS